MSDYSNDDGAPLPPRKGLHAKPEDLGSLVTDSVRTVQSHLNQIQQLLESSAL